VRPDAFERAERRSPQKAGHASQDALFMLNLITIADDYRRRRDCHADFGAV
jgi:hypothetical protein